MQPVLLQGLVAHPEDQAASAKSPCAKLSFAFIVRSPSAPINLSNLFSPIINTLLLKVAILQDLLTLTCSQCVYGGAGGNCTHVQIASSDLNDHCYLYDKIKHLSSIINNKKYFFIMLFCYEFFQKRIKKWTRLLASQ